MEDVVHFGRDLQTADGVNPYETDLTRTGGRCGCLAYELFVL